jgi:hypothetical protein
MTDDSLIAFLKWRDCLPVGMSSRSSEGSPVKCRESTVRKDHKQTSPHPPSSYVGQEATKTEKISPSPHRFAMRALAPRCKDKTDSEEELTEVTESSVSCFSSCAKGLLGREKKKDGRCVGCLNLLNPVFVLNLCDFAPRPHRYAKRCGPGLCVRFLCLCALCDLFVL